MTSMFKPTDSFMTCILKVNKDRSGWEKTMQKVLGNMQGVNNFRMGANGRVLISGKVTPTILLKVLGKAGNKAEIIWWQFGQCSSNLFLPVNNQTMYGPYGYGTTSNYGYGTTYGYDGYGGNNYYQGGYGGNRLLDDTHYPWPKYPAECGNKKVVLNHKDEREEQPACCTIM